MTPRVAGKWGQKREKSIAVFGLEVPILSHPHVKIDGSSVLSLDRITPLPRSKHRQGLQPVLHFPIGETRAVVALNSVSAFILSGLKRVVRHQDIAETI